jgi:hypothetical protein
MRARNGFPQRQAPGSRQVMRVAGAQLVYGAFDDRSGSVQVRIADTQDDDVCTALARRNRRIVSAPRHRTLTAHTLDQC